MTKPELRPCADCGQLCREIDSPREEHAADCPHWEGVCTHAHASHLTECHRCTQDRAEKLRARVEKMEAAITNAIEMFSGNEGGPVEGIDWSGEIGMLRAALEEK